MNGEKKDSFIVDLEETIDKIRDNDEFVAFTIANMAAIVEHSEDAIIGIDLEGTILSWNNGAQKMYHYSTEEAMGKNFSVLISPHRPNELSYILEKINKDELIQKYETKRQTKDGGQIDVSVTISSIKDSRDRIVGASAIEKDITERKEAEEALKRSEEKYRRLFDDDLTGDFIATPEGKIKECNPAFTEIYGFESREQALESFISEFNAADWVDLVNRLKTEKKIYGHQTNHTRPDKKGIHVVANVVGIFNESKKLVEVKGYIFDDTERKEAEDALKKSEEKYRRLFDDDLTGDFIATPEGKIEECNPAFAEIYGFRGCEQATGYKISQFNQADWENLINRLKTEHKIRGHQTTHIRPDGKEIYVVTNVVGMLDESGELIEVKGYIFDYTQRKKAEEALKKQKN